MIVDLEHPDTPSRFEVETLIIGGGAVGLAMLADRVRRGERVLLLEAGGTSVEDSSQNIVRSATHSGHLHEGVHAGRFRVLGGATLFWGGQLARFDDIVFEPRPAVDGQGWPIGRAELDEHYDRAMSLLGMDEGLEQDQAVLERTGVRDVGEMDGLTYFFTRWTREPNLAAHFRDDIASPLAQVLVHANVVGFTPAGDGRHEVVAKTLGGRTSTIAARHIILACGTMEISRLLLLPYADGSPAPWSGNPWLGKAYYDHIDVNVGNVTPIDKKRFDLLFENIFLKGYKYNPKLKLDERIQREKGLLQACGAFIYSTSYKENAANLRHFLRSLRRGEMPKDWRKIPGHIWALWRIALPMTIRYLKSNRTFHPKGSAIHLRITTEQMPLARSHFSLTETRDALQMPAFNLHWAIDGREIETVASCAEAIKAYLEDNGLALVDLDDRIARRDPALLDDGDDTNHQMGGARMGKDASDGVVDTNLKLFGTQDIYVAGAAAMPTSGFVNCTLTAIALGLRLNQHLREQ